ncbi:WXG100 family type VII secretion target [Mycolicibacterium celeriflavum]|uniref:WXG100 family type VII secretion target n=1 Tax=Mycolicibacterium celeriflavum TaxID=1249101 RepID=UPI003CF3EBEB
MPKDLEVDPIDLRMSSDHMDMHHSDLLAAHTAANGAIEEAQAGWVGASAAALTKKFAEWQEATATMAEDIAAHGAAFRSAASGYQAADAKGAAAIDNQL